ncbi:MAG: hypothetical protein V1859_08950 [archaeon]
MGFFGKLFGKKDEFDFKPPKDSELGLDFNKNPTPDFGAEPDFGANDLNAPPGRGQYQDTRSQRQLPTFEPTPQTQFQQFPSQQSYQQQDPAYVLSKNMEVISSKLDALRAAIESINQRLINLENIAKGEQERPRYRW